MFLYLFLYIQQTYVEYSVFYVLSARIGVKMIGTAIAFSVFTAFSLPEGSDEHEPVSYVVS